MESFYSELSAEIAMERAEENQKKEDELRKKIKEARNISESSLNAYIRNMKVMNEALNDSEKFEPEKWIGDIERVRKYLKSPNPRTGKHSISTEKTKIATILVVLRLDGKENYDKIQEYTKYLDEVKQEYDKGIASHKKSLRESDNWVGLSDLKKVFNKLARAVKNEEINKAGKIILSKKESELLQQYLVAGLYTLIPPNRNRDFSEMKFITEKEFKELTEEDKETNNYLVIKNRQNKYFSFGDYKTKKKMGVIKQDIKGALNQVINLWYKFNKNRENKALILNARGNKMSANSLTKYLMKIFSSTGKQKIGSSMLRHIYSTHNEDSKKYREAKAKAEENAKLMKHTLEQHDNYVKY